MGYATPTDAPVSDDWAGHKYRDPPSREPGTDYGCAYGSDLRIAGDGVVAVIDWSNGGGEGRRLSVNLDDGRRVSYIHLSRIEAYLGQRVTRGQTGLIWSGASGQGDDYYYGAHVHVSLWEQPGMSYADSIDFELYTGDDEGDDMNAEQDNRLRNIENLLVVPGAGYGWPQVAGQGVQDVQTRLTVPGAGYDWLPAINNNIYALWRPVAIAAAAAAVIIAVAVTRRA